MAALAGAVVVAAGVAGAVVLGRGDDEDGGVVTSDDDPAPPASPVVAVVYGDASVIGEPAELLLTFLDAEGDVLAERSWSEVEEAVDGEVVVTRGLLQEVPPGDLRLEAMLVQGDEPMSCTQQFTARAGDRLILRVQLGTDAGPGADPVCARVETVDEWVDGFTTSRGAAYVGLTEELATAQAEAEGLTTRVVGVDGMNLVVTMDLRTDRLDLMLFDGVVVAANLPEDEPLSGPASTGG